MDERDPQLEIDRGTPISGRYGDVYFSRDGGIEETRHVFLQGCGLPERWAGQASFTIGELGFGTGLNFLVAWQAWQETADEGVLLHFLSVEKHPISREDLGRILVDLGPLDPLAEKFLARYRDFRDGVHRLWFDDDQVSLTLLIGEAAEVLSQAEASVDAWFLDGFSPARSPDMWSSEVLGEITRLSHPGARLATFTAAGAVRRGLASLGWAVEKRKGFGHKRDCVAARYERSVETVRAPWLHTIPASPSSVAVIGGGIAGAALTRAFSRRGGETIWVERRQSIAAEASGNPVGLIMPRPSLGEAVGGKLTVEAYSHTVGEMEALAIPPQGEGLVELLTSPTDIQRAEVLVESGELARAGGRLLTAREASDVAGVTLDMPALHFGEAGWIKPRDWVEALSTKVARTETDVLSLERSGEQIRLIGEGGEEIATVDAVIFALGASAADWPLLTGIPFEKVRGQISLLEATPQSRVLKSAITFGGYLTPAIKGSHLIGATYGREGFNASDHPMPLNQDDHQRNLEGLPSVLRALFGDMPSITGGNAALRSVTPDRLPVVGAVPVWAQWVEDYAFLMKDAKRLDGPEPSYQGSLYILGGLGSRGLVTAPLLAELLAAQMFAEPWPVERRIADALHPGRFLIRNLKWGKRS